MIYISKYCSFAEATKTSTGLPNVPTDKEIAAMQLVAQKVFDKVREYFGYALGVNSFFRCEAVNKAVGGAVNSEHVLGQAIDIDGKIGGITNRSIFDYIKDHLEFNQLIFEGGTQDEPAWVHVSYSANGNKKQVLRMIKENGKTKYIPYEKI
jgi:zinc D-Ala-D-Ala carboxypeptidase